MDNESQNINQQETTTSEVNSTESNSTDVKAPEVNTAEVKAEVVEASTAEASSDTDTVAEQADSSEQVEQAKPEEVKTEQAEDSSAKDASSPESAEQEEQEEGAENRLPKLDPTRAALPWYVVHTYSGFESRVKLSLEERIRSAGMHEQFGHIVVPEENVVELVRGEKKTSKRKFFPGYMLIQCDLNEDSWHLVKDTPKVTGFVGNAVDPVPLSKEEVSTLLEQMEGGATTARASVDFESGDAIKVVDGPFADFNGTVEEVKPDKGKLRVLISIFGRNTPVELDFVQVEKV